MPVANGCANPDAGGYGSGASAAVVRGHALFEAMAGKE